MMIWKYFIEHVSTEARNAAMEKLSIEDNPYPKNSKAYDVWNKSFTEYKDLEYPAYEKGKQDFRDGKTLGSNPYNINVDREGHMDWNRGFSYMENKSVETNRQKVIREGYKAYKHGKSITSNPYKKGTPDFFDWNSGWYELQKEEPRPYKKDKDMKVMYKKDNALQKGGQAFKAGKKPTDNPYDFNREQTKHQDWAKGFVKEENKASEEHRLKVREEGRQAYEAGNKISHNPYERHTADYSIWNSGWYELYDEDNEDEEPVSKENKTIKSDRGKKSGSSKLEIPDVLIDEEFRRSIAMLLTLGYNVTIEKSGNNESSFKFITEKPNHNDYF